MKQAGKMLPVAIHGETAVLRQALAELALNRSIILVNEQLGHSCFVCPAQMISDAEINLMARFGRGLICLALPIGTVDRLNLNMMPTQNRTKSMAWRYTVSIEAGAGISTGISASDRAHTIRTAAAPDARPGDVVSPGHVFPVRVAVGHAEAGSESPEAALCLVSAARCGDAAVVCMILNDDGDVATTAEAWKLSLALGRVALSTDMLDDLRYSAHCSETQ